MGLVLYWLYDNDKPIGYGKLRHRLNNNLLELGDISGMSSGRRSEGKDMARGCWRSWSRKPMRRT